MLRVSRVIGLRFCSFGIAEVLWKVRDDRELGKVVGKGGGHEQGPAWWCSDALSHYPAVLLLTRESRKPPSQPQFPWQQKGALILVRVSEQRALLSALIWAVVTSREALPGRYQQPVVVSPFLHTSLSPSQSSKWQPAPSSFSLLIPVLLSHNQIW